MPEKTRKKGGEDFVVCHKFPGGGKRANRPMLWGGKESRRYPFKKKGGFFCFLKGKGKKKKKKKKEGRVRTKRSGLIKATTKKNVQSRLFSKGKNPGVITTRRDNGEKKEKGSSRVRKGKKNLAARKKKTP